MTFKVICLIGSILICFNTQSAYANCSSISQGEIVKAQLPKTDTIIYNNKNITQDEDGTFLIATSRDAQKQEKITINNNQDMFFEVSPTAWDIQKLQGVQPRKVTPKAEDETPIINERNLLISTLDIVSHTPHWKNGFIIPVEGRISGKFGGQRIMNGIKKNPHAGMDIAAPIGTDVKASGDGTIVLAEKNLFYSGNVIIIDHGFGLHTIYAHLNDFVAQKGDFVKKGQLIAHVGKTGRVTGPHLHWGASLQGIKFNPQSLTQLLTKNNLCLTEKQ